MFAFFKVKDDILIRCKHYFNNEIRYPVFRVMLNTGFFFDNVLRIYKVEQLFFVFLYMKFFLFQAFHGFIIKH